MNKTIKKFINFLFKANIYAVVILWPYSKLQNLNQELEYYESILVENIKYYNLNIDIKNHRDYIALFFLLYTLFELIFALGGLFDSLKGHIVSIIFFILTNFIYFNPFIKENSITLLQTREELFMNIGVLISMLVLAFRPREIKEQTETIIYKKIEEDELMRETMPRKKNRKKF